MLGNEAEGTNNYGGYAKTPVLFKAVCGSKFMKFWDNVGDLSYFPMLCPIVYVTFRPEDIFHLPKSRNC